MRHVSLLNFAVSLLGHQNICEGRGAHKIKKIMGDNQAAEMRRLEQKRDRKTTESNQGLGFRVYPISPYNPLDMIESTI